MSSAFSGTRRAENKSQAMSAKRQRRVVGDIVEILLPDGFYGYAITLEEATYAIYDLHPKTRQRPPESFRNLFSSEC